MSRTAALNGIYELAKIDERIIFIGSDLAPNTLAKFKEEFPDRFFMAGVQEQAIIGMAAGMAMEGYIPYVNTIASFLTRRCYEQIVLDICAHNLPVRLIGNGGGNLYGPLGLTHQAIEDIAIMRSIPNMQIICCSDSKEMEEFMPETITNLAPMYIRLGKDTDIVLRRQQPYKPQQIIWRDLYSGTLLMIGTGVMTDRLLKAAKILDKSLAPMGTTVIHMPQIKPIPNNIIDDLKKASFIVTCEEGIRNGGLGTAILELMSDNGIHVPMFRLGLPDAFPHHYGEQDDLLRTYGLQPEQIAQRVKEAYERF